MHWSTSTPPASGSIFASNSYLIIVNVKMLSTICCWEFYMFLFWYTFFIINRFDHTVVKTHCYFTLAWLFWVSQLDWLFYIYVNNCNFDQLQNCFFWNPYYRVLYNRYSDAFRVSKDFNYIYAGLIITIIYTYIHLLYVLLSFFYSMSYKCSKSYDNREIKYPTTS